ncbi:aconitase X swivel domain-containing protein [Specibacter sp. RAF43]|uniref:aconitase X swivel domain-containing protein n=1 Tax=Specibacter sp. RAF43 TaxID=3233057 RepID=UPI003F9903CA
MTISGVEWTCAGTTLCAGQGSGDLLVLAEPLSFWGGTDRRTGVIIDARHPQHGTSLAGRVLMMDASRGSSSSSSVLAEQLRAGVGPAAILLTARDAILALGALAAAELYGIQVPVVLLDAGEAAGLAAAARACAAGGARVSVTAAADGRAGVELFPPGTQQPTKGPA